MNHQSRILYCHCAYAQVVPKETKASVLKSLCDARVPFEAVADLCEMAARRDPGLRRLAEQGTGLKIAACYPRAVRWLFHATGVPLSPEQSEVLNMRTQSAQDVVAALFRPELLPNLPTGLVAPPSKDSSAGVDASSAKDMPAATAATSTDAS